MNKSQKDHAIVLGENLAKARQVEEQRLTKSDIGLSPLLDKKYDFWQGDYNLANPVSNSLDSFLDDLVQQFVQSDPQVRTSIRESISMDEFYTLLTYARRSAVFALRDRKAKRIKNGLIAVAMIECDRTDFRDVFSALFLLHHSALRVGVKTDPIFREMIAIAENKVGQTMERFIGKTLADINTGRACGYVEVKHRQGYGYFEDNLESFAPTYNMAQLDMDIGDLIATDKYMPDSFCIGSTLPHVWLGPKEDTSLMQLLETIRAGSRVSARLRPDKHPDAEKQRLWFFCVELQNSEAASALLKISIEHKSKHFASLGMAKESLFCLIVARSVYSGIESFETHSSLLRFADGLDKILTQHSKLSERLSYLFFRRIL